MMLAGGSVVLAVSALVGVVNGAIISRLQVNPFIATLGVGLILQGLLSASFTDFAGSVPKEFQARRLWRVRRRALFGRGPVRARRSRLVRPLGDPVRRSSLRRRRQRRRRAPGGDQNRPGHHRRPRRLQPFGRPHRPLSRQPSALRRALGRARRRLRSRIDRGRGDRRHVACRRTRRRLGDARRRPSVRHSGRGVQHARAYPPIPNWCFAARSSFCAVAVYTFRTRGHVA